MEEGLGVKRVGGVEGKRRIGEGARAVAASSVEGDATDR